MQGGKANFAIEFFVYFYSIFQNINQKIDMYDPQFLSYDTIKA